MKKRIKVLVTVMLEIEVEGQSPPEIDDIINEIDYNFISKTDNAEVVDSEIRDCEEI